MQYYKVQNDSNRYLVEWDFDTFKYYFLNYVKEQDYICSCIAFFGTDLKMNENFGFKME